MIAVRSATETERVREHASGFRMSHDLRTPLSSILGSATSLLDYGDKLEPEAQKDRPGEIKQEAEALDDMVRNLLAITRIDAGALELRKDWIDVHEIVGRVVSAARRQRPSTRTIEVELPREMPLVRGRPDARGSRRMTNIVANAIAHSPERTRVTIGAQVLPSQVKISVLDDRPGHSAELMPRLFESSRVPGNREQAQGAGLASCHCQRHHGRAQCIPFRC